MAEAGNGSESPPDAFPPPLPTEAKPKAEKVAQRASHAQPGLLIETIKTGNGLRFAIWNGGGPTGKPKVMKGYRVDGKGVMPPLDPFGCAGLIVSLPSEPGKLAPTEELVDEIADFLHRYVDLPEFWERLASYYALATWVYDRFWSFGYIHIEGEWSAGKSRFMEVMGEVSYRAIKTTGAGSVSTFFRLMDIWRGSMLIDEADIKDSGSDSRMIQIANDGFGRRGVVLINEKANGEWVPRPFKVFCPKILATRGEYKDDGIESRCIKWVPTREKKIRADVPYTLSEKFEREGLELRNKLLSWRAANWESMRPSEAEVRGSHRHLEPRTIQLALPLWTLSEGDEIFRDGLVEFLHERSQNKGLEKPRVIVVEALMELRGQTVSLKQISDVAEGICEEAGEEKLTPQKLGRVLRDLGFSPTRNDSRNNAWERGARLIHADRDEVDTLAKEYLK